MASYARFLGRKVTVQYRAGDIVVPASGTFVADSGRSIFLEQHVEQRGKRSYFRWEIPYGYLQRIEEIDEHLSRGAAPEALESRAVAAGAGRAQSEAASILSLPQSPKTA